MMATSAVQYDDWDFIVKLDGDLTFSSDYFEKCFAHFESDPRLGIGGGDIYHDLEGLQSGSKSEVSRSRSD